MAGNARVDPHHRKCESGIAASCYQHALTLQKSGGAKDAAKSAIYMRRACTMAYTPACTQHTEHVAPGAKHADAPTKGGACFNEAGIRSATITGKDGAVELGKVAKDSPWEKTGFKAGDKLVSIGGKPAKTQQEILAAFSSQPQYIEILRAGKTMSLPVPDECP